MYTGTCRLLQGEKRIEIGKGEYSLDNMSADVRCGEVKIEAAYGARIYGGYDADGVDALVLETNTGERFNLAEVWHVSYFDKSKQDIDYYRGWRGVARTEITVKFRKAIRQPHWRPSLLKAGIP